MHRDFNEDLPDSAYLYVKGDVKKLPYRTASGALDWDRIPAAVAAVTYGYRGQVVDLPMEERKRIARKLLRIYRENDKEPPESLLKFLGQSDENSVRMRDTNEVQVRSVDYDVVTCVLHMAGTTLNRVRYDSNLLKQRYQLWEGVYAFNNHAPSHAVSDIVGVYQDVTYEERTGEVVGKLLVAPNYKWVLDLARTLKQAGKSLPLSSVLEIDARYNAADDVWDVNDIYRVESVDLVTEGATSARIVDINSVMEEQENMNEEVKKDEVQPPSTTVDVNSPQSEVVRVLNQNTLLTLFNHYDFPAWVKQQLQRHVLDSNTLIEYNKLEELGRSMAEEFAKAAAEYNKKIDLPPPATVESEPRDKLHAALEGFFLDRDVNNVPRFKSFREFYEGVTGDKGITGRIANYDLKRFAHFMGKDVNSITSDDFSVMLSNYLNRRLVQEYDEQMQLLGTWRQFTQVVPVRDFRPQRRVRFGGYGDLPIVAQGANYSNLTELTDEEATYSVQKRGGTEDLTLEAIANDDVGFIRRIPVKLARAAARTLHQFVYNDLIANNPTIYDGASLFGTHSVPVSSGSVNQSNSATKPTSYSITHFRDARLAMRKFVEMNSGKALGIVPRFVVVPPDLEDLIFGMLNAERYPRLSGTANTENFPPNDANWASRWGLQVLVNLFSPATDSLILVADPADVVGVELGFFGSEEPEIIVQDRPDVGSMFAADKITYKIRHIYGGAIIDWRAFYGYI